MSEEKKAETADFAEKDEAVKADASENAEKTENAEASESAETSENAEGEGGTQTEAKQEMSAEDEAMSVKYMRLMADFQNFKRRAEKEKSDIYAYANEKIVSELLNVIDNFERALALGQEGDSFVEGMSLIFKQFQGVLEKAGVKEIEALGLDFDPNFHNAVMMEDSAEYESGKVSCVLQKGYTLNSKVIRPSMVKVAN